MLLLALLPVLASALPATYFNIFGLNACDEHIPETQHFISFQVSNPNAVYEQGGNEVANCSIKWNTSAPLCWTSCSTNGYPVWYTHLTPNYNPSNGYYYGNFSLDIAEYYVYSAPVLNNVSVIAEVGLEGHTCSNGAQSSECGIWSGYLP
ncbi:Hypothetical predicted protein [Lecanosticta acicola]|uniref:Uncharacterized protein n=1 Tax=Lecanosticta acicola TaxID=111012 RepID=A0AAI9EFJ9_9PEZI|nr:Hypothetical predicted protein [Lecanosticta acicola]